MKKHTTISKMSRNDDKTANDAKRKRLWRYIEDCFDVLGVSLEKFKNIKKKKCYGKYNINETLEELITTAWESKDGLPTQGKIYDSVKINSMEGDDIRKLVCHTVREFIVENFNDDVYEDLKSVIRDNIKKLDDLSLGRMERVKSEHDSLYSAAIFCLFGVDISNEEKLSAYFADIEKCYKRYESDESVWFNEDDIKLIDFLRINDYLQKAIDDLELSWMLRIKN
ncbi:MAG: hypothetical protein Q4G23_04675 [Clostridia bacterium]|nr:hypothetical protein [Clostridia bacterium]